MRAARAAALLALVAACGGSGQTISRETSGVVPERPVSVVAVMPIVVTWGGDGNPRNWGMRWVTETWTWAVTPRLDGSTHRLFLQELEGALPAVRFIEPRVVHDHMFDAEFALLGGAAAGVAKVFGADGVLLLDLEDVRFQIVDERASPDFVNARCRVELTLFDPEGDPFWMLSGDVALREHVRRSRTYHLVELVMRRLRDDMLEVMQPLM